MILRLLPLADACKECCKAKKDAEQKALTDYKAASVYVRKMTDKDIQTISSQMSSSQFSSVEPSQESLDMDPDFTQVCFKIRFCFSL